MKQKYINGAVSISNILMVIFSTSFVFSLLPNKLEIIFSMYAIAEDLKTMLTILLGLNIVMLITNLMNIIINKGNRKIVLWSIIPVIYYLITIINNLNSEIIPDNIILKLWAIIPIILCTISLVAEIRGNKRKKNIIFCLLVIIMSSIMIFVYDYNSSVWLVISAVMQLVHNKETVETSRRGRVILTVLLGVLFIIFICVITKYTTMVTKLHSADKDTAQLINQIKLGLDSEEIIENNLTLVKRDNKWGCINQTGKEIIPCRYDAISSIVNEHKFIIARRQNTYDVLSQSGRILVTKEESVIPYIKYGKKEEMLKTYSNIKNPENQFLLLLQLNLAMYIDNSRIDDYEKIAAIIPEDYEYNEDYNTVYRYNLKNGYEMYVEEIKLKDKETYNIQIKRHNKVVCSLENVMTTLAYTKRYGNYEDGTILTYTSGDIPFYNLDKQVHGYYSINEANIKSLNGKYRILDVIKDRVIIRDYNDLSKTKDYIMNVNTGEILLVSKDISAYECGYIIQRDNNRFIYMDNNLNERTKEFDFISPLDTGEIIVCGEDINDTRSYYLYDFEGNQLTNYAYSAIKEEAESKPNHSPSNYLFDRDYYSYYYENK